MASDEDPARNDAPATAGEEKASASTAGPSGQGEERIDPRLLELLVCPLTKSRLEYDAARQRLVSRAAGLAFPIRSGVPLMIVETAGPLED